MEQVNFRDRKTPPSLSDLPSWELTQTPVICCQPRKPPLAKISWKSMRTFLGNLSNSLQTHKIDLLVGEMQLRLLLTYHLPCLFFCCYCVLLSCRASAYTLSNCPLWDVFISSATKLWNTVRSCVMDAYARFLRHNINAAKCYTGALNSCLILDTFM